MWYAAQMLTDSLASSGPHVQSMCGLQHLVLASQPATSHYIAPMQVSGCHVGSKGKKEVLDKLTGLTLFNPTHICSAEEAEEDLPAQAGPVAEQAVSSLRWVQPGTEMLAGGTIITSCALSCCQLPSVHVHLPLAAAPVHGAHPVGMYAAQSQQQQQQQEQQPPAARAPAQHQGMRAGGQPDSPANFPAAQVENTWERGGSPTCLLDQLVAELGSPEASGGQQLAGESGSPEAKAGGQVQQPVTGAASLAAAAAAAAGQGPALLPSPAAWLVEGMARIGEASQGSSEPASGKSLLGRRVAFVSLEDFEQGDEQGIMDTLAGGVQEGQ